MKNIIILLILICFNYITAQRLTIPVDTIVKTYHKTIIKGIEIDYSAEAGMQPVWDESGKIIASLFYTYYKRDFKKNSQKNKKRPIIISFNGGPGSASVWMHMAYTGPRILNVDDEGYPIQPYGFKSNPYSILDEADIVFVNPVNTAYSRMVPDSEGEMPDRDLFFGINEDISYLSKWINTFITRKNLWESPKYIIGESYGGTRVMGLSLALQENEWMYLNGVILVSPADYKTLRVGGPVSSALNLPYYTATAWYHNMLPNELQSKDLIEILPQVEDFALNTLIPALAKGGFISKEEKLNISKKMSFFSGLSQNSIIQHNLDVPNYFFWKELLRKKSGQTIGRLDSRYLGIDKKEAGSSPDYNAELSSWLHSFTPAINHYIKNELKFITDIKYNMFGPVRPWNNDNDNTRDNLRLAMAQNPFLMVLNQSGYYDGATTYFNAKYTLSQIDPSGKMKDRIKFKGYRSGHMMYLRKEDLIQANEDLREFIRYSSPNDKSAKY